MESIQPRGFKKARQKAEKLLHQKDRLSKLFEQAQSKAKQKARNLTEVKNELSALIRLIQAWTNGSYNKIPVKSIVYAIAAVVYFVNPLDLIPDFILFTGFLDDISVVSFVVKSIREDIDAFLSWENSQNQKHSQ